MSSRTAPPAREAVDRLSTTTTQRPPAATITGPRTKIQHCIIEGGSLDLTSAVTGDVEVEGNLFRGTPTAIRSHGASGVSVRGNWHEG